MNNCTTTTLFLKKTFEIADGRAETIMDAMKQWVMENKVGFERCVGFGSDGASMMVGSKTGIATRMKAMNPFIVSLHCATIAAFTRRFYRGLSVGPARAKLFTRGGLGSVPQSNRAGSARLGLPCSTRPGTAIKPCWPSTVLVAV